MDVSCVFARFTVKITHACCPWPEGVGGDYRSTLHALSSNALLLWLNSPPCG